MAEEEKQEQNQNDGIFGSYESIHGAAKAVESLEPEYKPREHQPDKETAVESESGEQEDTVENIEEPEPEQPEDDSEYFDVDGNSVSFNELKAGYTRDRGNTQQAQTLAEDKQKMAQGQNYLMQQSQQYVQALEALNKRLGDRVEAVDNTELERLRTEDPMEYFAKRDELRDTEAEQKRVQESIGIEQQKQAQEYQAHHTELLQREANALKSKLPEWSDPKKGQALRDQLKGYAKTQGYKDEEVSGIADHRAIMILRKAMLYDGIKGADAGGKKTRNAPRVQRPRGSSSRGVMGTDKRNRQNKKLKQTGRVDDAASLIFDLIE